MYPTSINIPKPTLINQEKKPTDTSDTESLIQDYSIHNKPYPPTFIAQDNLIPHTKLLLLKYIHQYLGIFPYICPVDTTDEKQCRSDIYQKNSARSLSVDDSGTNPTSP